MRASASKRMKQMEAELFRLKRMYADLALQNNALKDLIEKKLQVRRFRTFNFIEDFNREALYIEIDTSITGRRLILIFDGCGTSADCRGLYGLTTAQSS